MTGRGAAISLPAASGALGAPGGPRLRAARRAWGLVRTTALLVIEGRLEDERSPRRLGLRAQRTARALLAQHGVTVSPSGPPPPSPAILVSNHVSYLDPLVVACAVPCIAVAKGETRGWPLIGPGLGALGVLFVRRGDAHSGAVVLRRIVRALDDGATVLNFPEGTTSDGAAVGPFARGIFGLSRITGVPVVPALVAYDEARVPWVGGSRFAPHYLRLCGTPRVAARVEYAEPLAPGAAEDAAAMAERARSAVEALRAAHARR